MSECPADNDAISSDPKAARRHRRPDWAILLPLVNLLWIVVFLSDYSNVWVAPEANKWRGYLSESRPFSETLRAAFNWDTFETQPRLTRPLSSLFETLDNSLRKWLWRKWTPHPTLSLTYFFTLLFTPALLYRVLRGLGVREFLAWCGVALYLCNPAVLSLLALGFRPGKAMAIFATVFVLWWASQLKTVSLLAVAPLYLFLFFSFFWDEIALIAFLALLLLFPRVVFSNRKSTGIFFLIPVGYALSVRWLLPAIYAAAGFPVPPNETYAPLERFTSWVTFGSSSGAGGEFQRYFFTNSRIALMDSLGLINPALPGLFTYYAIFGAILACLVIFTIVMTRRLFSLREAPWKGFRRDSVVIRAVTFLVICLVFHEMLLSVVGQKTWGLYWYGAFISLGFVIAAATLLERLHIQSWLAAAFVLLVSMGSFTVFPATNRAYKSFHYYPYRALLLRSVFKNEINRFHISGPGLSGAEIRGYTKQLVSSDSGSSAFAAPAELLYVVYELNLHGSSEGCKLYHPTFTLVRSAEGSRLDCFEAVVSDEAVKPFLGEWLTPSPVTITPNRMFVVLDEGVPKRAQVDNGHIEIIGQQLTGQLSADGRTLVWASGTIWERRSGELSSFEGKWWFNGTSVIRRATNRDVLMGNKDPAMVQRDGTIIAPQLGMAGALSIDRKRIVWSEGPPWVRPDAAPQER